MRIFANNRQFIAANHITARVTFSPVRACQVEEKRHTPKKGVVRFFPRVNRAFEVMVRAG